MLIHVFYQTVREVHWLAFQNLSNSTNIEQGHSKPFVPLRYTLKKERTPSCSGAPPITNCLTGQYHTSNSRVHVTHGVLKEIQKHFYLLVSMSFPMIMSVVLAVYVVVIEDLAGDIVVLTASRGDMIIGR